MLPRLLFFLLMLGGMNAGAQTLKIMSYNIHHGADRAEVNTLEQMGAFIKTSGADLIGLQEVDSVCTRSGKVDQMKRLAEITGMHYAFIRHFAFDGGAYGLGILSRYPIGKVKNNRISLLPPDPKKPSLGFLTAEISLPGKKRILFTTVHFGLNVPSRKVQSEEVLALASQTSLPMILTGDLNATPESQEISLLRGKFSEAGPDDIFTFPETIPVKKIDYIMVSKKHLKNWRQAKADRNKLSDHLPLMGTIRLKRKGN